MISKYKGDYGEKLAARELIKKGYAIREKNYHTRIGEIDIIAEKDNTVVFVEVKLRKDTKYGLPCEAVDLRKQKKIIETAKDYIQKNDLYNKNFRFDVIEILIQEKIFMRQTENAFGE